MCARCATVSTCWSGIVQEQFGGEGQPGFEEDTWGVSEDESALGEGEGEATVDVG